MVLYDIISQIAKQQCEKLYEVKIAIGFFDTENQTVTINDLQYDIEDIILSETVCDKIDDEDFSVVCVQTQNYLFVIDKLGVI